MSLILCSLLYILVHSKSVQPAKIIKNPEFKPVLPAKDLDGGIEVIELFGKNNSDVPKRIKRLDSDETNRSPDSQKLIFYPSRTLKPPRTLEKPKVINFHPIPPNHRMSSRMTKPRPFKHMMASGSKPNGFKVQSTARSFNQQLNNINDVIQHNQGQYPGMKNQNQGPVMMHQNHFQGSQGQFHGNQGQFYGNQGQHFGNGQGQVASIQQGQHFPGYQNQKPTQLHQTPNHQNQFTMNQNQFPYQNPHQVKKKKKARFPPQLTSPEATSMHPVQLAGTYRHPRKDKDFTKMMQSDIQQSHLANQHQMPDPFYNYKPESAFEINQMVTGATRLPPNTVTQNSPYFRRKFKQQIASIPDYQIHSKDVAGIYENVLNSGKKFQVDRNEMSKAKPIQLMLDVYPANGEETGVQQLPQMTQQVPMVNQVANMMQQMPNMMIPQYPRIPRLKPFQGYYQDPSYFNSMTFPQLMPSMRYPSFYRYPKLQAQSSNVNSMSVAKPSQLVVHLNLFPKDKTSFKRSSTEDEINMTEKKKKQQESMKIESANSTAAVPFNINFNVNTGNGHPENIHHHVNLPKDPYFNKDVDSDSSYRPNNYYYDDNDNDQSIQVAPSLVYQNIHRDRPIHLMLKNATAATEKTVKKPNNHKHKYETIERPRKQQKIKNEPRNFVESLLF